MVHHFKEGEASFVTGWDQVGREIGDSNSDLCVVKKVETPASNRIDYFVKASAGRTSSMFYNPATDSFKLTSTDGVTKRPCFSFTRVDKEVFDYYIEFIKSGRTELLRLAERKARSG